MISISVFAVLNHLHDLNVTLIQIKEKFAHFLKRDKERDRELITKPGQTAPTSPLPPTASISSTEKKKRKTKNNSSTISKSRQCIGRGFEGSRALFSFFHSLRRKSTPRLYKNKNHCFVKIIKNRKKLLRKKFVSFTNH